MECCVFWPAISCCVHPIAGQNILFGLLHFFLLFQLKSRNMYVFRNSLKLINIQTLVDNFQAYLIFPKFMSSDTVKHQSKLISLFSWFFKVFFIVSSFEVKVTNVPSPSCHSLSQNCKAPPPQTVTSFMNV